MLLPVLFTLEGFSLLLAKDIFSGRNQTITSGGGESGRKFSRSKPSCDWRGRSEGAGTEKATKTAEADQDHATVSPFPSEGGPWSFLTIWMDGGLKCKQQQKRQATPNTHPPCPVG